MDASNRKLSTRIALFHLQPNMRKTMSVKLERKELIYYTAPPDWDRIDVCDKIHLPNAHAEIISECKREIIFNLPMVQFPDKKYSGLWRGKYGKCLVSEVDFKTFGVMVSNLMFRLSTARKNKPCWGGSETVAIFEPCLSDVVLYNPRFEILEFDDDQYSDDADNILDRAMISSARFKGYLPDETYIDQLVYPTFVGHSDDFPPTEMRRALWAKPALKE